MPRNLFRRNTITFGMGTIGRDMVYNLITMYLIVYLTEVVNVSDGELWWISSIILFARVFDALNDPVMGVVVDNTRTKWGKFKPWILIGVIFSGIITILLFTDFGLTGVSFIVLFAILYLLWGISWTINDIAYWSMMPSLTTDQKKREKMGSVARICATLGMAIVIVGFPPITSALTDSLGDAKLSHLIFAVAVVALLWIFQSITLLGVKEPKGVFKQEKHTGVVGLFRAIIKNDQLLFTAIAMVLFMIGYVTTTSFGYYFFKYAYGDEGMFPIFAGVVILSQIVALGLFPLFSKFWSRKTLYTSGTIMVIIGYLFFFFSPMEIIPLGIAGLLIFFGQGFIQILMLMFLADSIEYGQWKLGKRNESITFSVQPFINKAGGAVAGFILGSTLIVSGINEAEEMLDVSNAVASVTPEGLLTMKISMMIIPLIFIIAGYLVYLFKFKIDKKFYNKIISDLRERGDIKDGQ